MADTKLSALTAMTDIGTGDNLYVDDGGTSKKITGADLRNSLETGGGIVLADLPASVITSGTLAHERGGIEADISAVTTGNLLVGTGAGTMGVLTSVQAPVLSDSASEQVLDLVGPNRATPADNDEIYVSFTLEDSAANHEFARITAVAADVTDATEDGILSFDVAGAGSLVEALRLNSVASGANYIDITPAAVGGVPTVASAGSDTNLSVRLSSKGNGFVALRQNGVDRVKIESTGVVMQNNQFIQRDVNAGLTASTTQSQGQGALIAEWNEISTVANANDTVTLPAAAIGREVTIMNNGANTLQIFPASGDDLGAGVDTATTLASGSNVVYAAYDAANWESI